MGSVMMPLEHLVRFGVKRDRTVFSNETSADLS